MGTRRGSAWVSAVFAAGLAVLYVGERIVEGGTGRAVAAVFAAVLALGAVAWRVRRWSRATTTRVVEGWLLSLQGLALAAVALWAMQSDVPSRVGLGLLSQGAPRLATVLAVGWVALLVLALVPLVLLELSFAAMAEARVLELGRLRAALRSGFGVALLSITVFALQYAAEQVDVRWDLAYFRTARAGPATRAAVAGLTEPLQLTLFFPAGNAVGEEVQDWAAALAALSPKLTVERLDQALEPARAKALSVRANGTIVLTRGARSENIPVGTDFEKTRTALKNLDVDFYKKLLQLAKSQKTIYFTQGHGERVDEALGGREGVRVLKDNLKLQNYDIRTLSAAEGLASEVPKDAAAVVVLGPQSELQGPEIKALLDYARAGGRLLLALDPEAGLKHAALLEPLGLKLGEKLMLHDTHFARKSYTPADRANLATRSFSSHPMVTSTSRAGYPLLFLGATSLEDVAPRPASLTVDYVVRADPGAWIDLNGDWNYTAPPEVKKAWGIAAVVSQKVKEGKPDDEQRVVVVADSDAFTDAVLEVSPGNRVFVVDAMKWLLSDEALFGPTSTEADVPVIRTRKEDAIWFYGTTFLAPLAVLGAGFFLRRRRHKTQGPQASQWPAAKGAPS